MDLPIHPDTLDHQMDAYRDGLEKLRGQMGPMSMHLANVFRDFALPELQDYYTQRLTEFARAVTRTVPSDNWYPPTIIETVEALVAMDPEPRPFVYLGMLCGKASVLWPAYRILLAAYPDLANAALLFDLLYGALQANADDAVVALAQHLVAFPPSDYLSIRVRSVLAVAKVVDDHAWPAEVVSLMTELRCAYAL